MTLDPIEDSRRLLANAAWRCLAGPHAHYTRAHGGARRYARGLAPIAAFADPRMPDLAGLAALSEPGERLYLPGVARADHPAWKVLHALRYTQMVRRHGRAKPWHGALVRRLSENDLPALQPLLAATGTTLFGPGMLAVADHFGLFEGDELVSAAAMRLVAGPYREISTVCTRPDRAGRGYASALVNEVAARIEAGGQVPFLHVAESDKRAAGVYARCGFEAVQVVPLLVVQGSNGSVAQ